MRPLCICTPLADEREVPLSVVALPSTYTYSRIQPYVSYIPARARSTYGLLQPWEGKDCSLCFPSSP